MKGPVSYTSFGLTGLAALGVLIYYNYEKERRLEKVSGDVVHVGECCIYLAGCQLRVY